MKKLGSKLRSQVTLAERPDRQLRDVATREYSYSWGHPRVCFDTAPPPRGGCPPAPVRIVRRRGSSIYAETEIGGAPGEDCAPRESNGPQYFE